jgi:hypothetical protein
MKKTISLILALVMSLSLVGVLGVSAAEVYDGTSVSASLAGAGTEADPYLIANGADLAFFAANAAAGASYKLTADIVWATAPTATNWTPVVDFSGTFDGNGYSISGLYVVGTKQVAFIGSTKDTAVIKNLTIKDSRFEGDGDVAGIVGFVTPGTLEAPAYITVENCVNYADIFANKKDGNSAGIIGDILTTGKKANLIVANISKCVNYGSVTSATGNGHIGGVVGRVSGTATVSECANFGKITGTSAIVGGVVGQVSYNGSDDARYTVTIENCYNAGEVIGTHVIGGIASRAYEFVTFKNCVNVGKVTVSKDDENANRFGAIESHTIATYENNYYLAGSASNSALPETVGIGNREGSASKTADELAALAGTLGEAWTVADGKLTLKAVAEAGKVEAPAPETTAPETTEPAAPETTAPETTEPGSSTPTGDSAFVFVMIGVIALAGVAVVAKRREN